jgi:nucleotide-binding universal stress UspA family protein
LDAKFVLTYVVPRYNFLGDINSQISLQAVAAQQEWGQKLLADAAQQLRDERHPVETVMSCGEAAEEIARLSDEKDAYLVLVGKKGQGMSRILLGSVANRLLHLCARPVLLA